MGIDSSVSQNAPETANKPVILIVDDSRLMRHAIKKILASEFICLQAVDGEDGWQKLQDDNAIQLVFSDLSMPVLDGYGLLSRIRGSDNPRISALPVIVITGNEENASAREKAIECGATDFITKPFQTAQLKECVARHATELAAVVVEAEIESRVLEAAGDVHAAKETGHDRDTESSISILGEEARAEAARVAAEEQARAAAEAEAARVAAEEKARAQAEAARVTAEEKARAQAEAARVAAEEKARAQAEVARVAAEEKARAQAEAARVAAEEKARAQAEVARVAAEVETAARLTDQEQSRRVSEPAQSVLQRRTEQIAKMEAAAKARKQVEDEELEREITAREEETARIRAVLEATRLAEEQENLEKYSVVVSPFVRILLPVMEFFNDKLRLGYDQSLFRMRDRLR